MPIHDIAKLSEIAKLCEEAYRQSVARLESQERRMLAADNRALVFAAVAVASAALTSGAEPSISDSMAWYVAALWYVAAFAFILSAAFAVFAARGLKVVAAHPKFSDFSQYFGGEYPYNEVISNFGKQNDESHNENDNLMKHNNRIYNTGIVIYFIGLILIYIDRLLILVA